MKQKKIVILFFILLCLISACYIISLQKSNTEKISPITQAEKYIEGYIYLDTNNRLCYNDTISNAVTIIEENVLDFKLANSNVVYLFRNSNGKHLAMYSFLTNESIILINNYIADFITYKDSLFYY